MVTQYLIDFYTNLLNMCVEKGLDFFETHDRESFVDWHYDNNMYGVDSDWGASRFVIWEDTLPYVIKIPFIDNRTQYKNYCEIEVEICERAMKTDIRDCFAETAFLCYYQGHPIYIMEKAICDEDELYLSACEAAENHKDMTEEFVARSEVENYSSSASFSSMDSMTQAEFLKLEEWGEDVADKFFSFSKENNINDQHLGNFGYIDNHLVIIDYCGF